MASFSIRVVPARLPSVPFPTPRETAQLPDGPSHREAAFSADAGEPFPLRLRSDQPPCPLAAPQVAGGEAQPEYPLRHPAKAFHPFCGGRLGVARLPPPVPGPDRRGAGGGWLRRAGTGRREPQRSRKIWGGQGVQTGRGSRCSRPAAVAIPLAHRRSCPPVAKDRWVWAGRRCRLLQGKARPPSEQPALERKI